MQDSSPEALRAGPSAKSHLGTLPNPIPTFGFCAGKGKSVMWGLGKVHGHRTGEQGGLGKTRGCLISDTVCGQHMPAGSYRWDTC